MKKIITVCLLLFIVSCGKSEGFTLQSFDSQIRQTLASAKGLPSTEIVTTINGETTVVNIDEAVVNFPNVRFDDGKYSFDISL